MMSHLAGYLPYAFELSEIHDNSEVSHGYLSSIGEIYLSLSNSTGTPVNNTDIFMFANGRVLVPPF